MTSRTQILGFLLETYIYLFWGFHCFSLVAASGSYSPVAELGLLTAVASLVSDLE